MNFRAVIILLLPVAVLVSGCMVGPDYERPETAAEIAAGFVSAEGGWSDGDSESAVGLWWESFNDPVINELVTEALEKNYDLKAAAATVAESEAMLRQSTGLRLPWVTYGAGRTRAKSASIIPAFPSEVGNTYSHDLSVSYVADVFGKLRRNERAAMAELVATESSRRALVHAVVAQVVRTRVQVATQQRLLEIADATVESREQTLKIVERRYPKGLVSPVDIYLARENVAGAKSFVPRVRQSVALSSHALDVLTGHAPSRGEGPELTLADMPDLSPIPVGLPAALLDRRPDVQAAGRRLVASTERVGVSIAEMYPDLTLTARGGYSSDHFRSVMDSDNLAYSFIMGIVAPIFRGGQLKAGVDAAHARADRAAANYANVVLNAMREVEDALVTHRMQAESLEYVKVRFDEAKRAETLAGERYGRGVENILTVLETERRRRLAENELVLTKSALYNARIDLFLALGGDWGEMAEKGDIEDSDEKL